MHPQITNKSAKTLDVLRFSFESAGALEFDNGEMPSVRLSSALERKAVVG
jgi:hypothetical protein